LSKLDRADPADRRLLLAADHDTRTGSTERGGRRPPHRPVHLALADRLWRGSPPALWDAAQRLLDTGEDRPSWSAALDGRPRRGGQRRAALKVALRELATGLSDDDLNGLANPDS